MAAGSAWLRKAQEPRAGWNPMEELSESGESPDGGVRQGFTAPHGASNSLPVTLIAAQKDFLEVSKEQAVMEFWCFYIWLDVDFSDFQEKA